MRKFCFIALGFLVSFGFGGLSPLADNTTIKGDYVEVRTASVFAGACHYNGELTTTGRDALMAWNFTAGRWNGIDLAGVRVMVVVSADDNLSNKSAARRSEIIIDEMASQPQASALVDFLKSNYDTLLGKIVVVSRGQVNFSHKGKSYIVSSPNVASISVDAMPNDLCCKMPGMVWYTPLVPLENRKVGYTKKATYAGKNVSDSWERSGENSAFYGQFSL